VGNSSGIVKESHPRIRFVEGASAMVDCNGLEVGEEGLQNESRRCTEKETAGKSYLVSDRDQRCF
jgi:hypothetical protein